MFLYALAEVVETLRDEGETLVVGEEKTDLSRTHLMQLDDLHPTRLGMAILGHRFSLWLNKTVPAANPAHLESPTIEDLLDITGGGAVLEAIKKPPKAPDRLE